MSYCTGRGDASGDHCCWVGGRVCEFLVENQDGRRFACGLMVELGDWDEVIADPRYAPLNIHWKGKRKCNTWQPKIGVCCREER